MKRINVTLFIFVLTLIACGTSIDSPDGEIIAPLGSQILISPEKYEVTDGSLASNRHYQLFRITVINSSGHPVGRVKLTIAYQWAIPDISGLVMLYDGACSDTNPPTNPPRNSPFEAVTDDNGTYSLCLGYLSGGGLEYKAGLEVWSGSVYNSADVSIKAQ